MENIYFCPETEMALFVLIDEDLTDIDKIIEGLENIGKFGFGRDASTGMGRFDECEPDEIIIDENDSANAFYTLRNGDEITSPSRRTDLWFAQQ